MRQMLSELTDYIFMFIPIIFVVGIIFIFFYRNRIKGRLGENRVGAVLKKLPEDYTIFNNIYLTEKGKTCQIDHVVFSPYGIFVIETKNFSGWIYGGENAQYWTKNVYGTKFQFYNPIYQNYGHVMALKSLLNFSFRCFIPIVVFAGNATLKSNFPHNTVIYSQELIGVILSYQQVLFKPETLFTAINKLSDSSFVTCEVVTAHLREVKDNIFRREKLIGEGVCPQCGGKLIYHHGKYGHFFGCSNYPNCHFILKI